jgi:2-dehydro-3-deoxyphosphooctonate aldolase (KDO 8-P synthase)
MEVHPDPLSSPSDGPNMIRLDEFEELLKTLLRIDGAVKQ